MSDVTWFDIVM